MRVFTLSLIVLFSTLQMGRLDAQHVVKIDFERVRDVINDDERAISIIHDRVIIDHDRALLFVTDREEPEGVMAFSFATGARVGTYMVPTGDGPGELPGGIGSIALAPDGGLYVAGESSVLRLDSQGNVAGDWRFRVPYPGGVCSLGDRPAIPIQGGILMQGYSGAPDEPLGRNAVVAEAVIGVGIDNALAAARRLFDTSIWCSGDTVFEATPRDDSADRVRVLRTDGTEGSLSVPTEFAEGFNVGWNRGLTLFGDGRGNLVLTGNGTTTAGAIVDPSTGCYAVMQYGEPSLHREFMGVFADSALVFHSERHETTEDGRRIIRLYADARQASLHPFRHVSGERCPGILPSLDDGQGSLDDPAGLDAPARQSGTDPESRRKLSTRDVVLQVEGRIRRNTHRANRH